jgi:hypothetical protein
MHLFGASILPRDPTASELLAAEMGALMAREVRAFRLEVSAALAELREGIATAKAERLQWTSDGEDTLAAWEMRIAQRMEFLRDGEKGDKGEPGEKGEPGRDGLDGRSFRVCDTWVETEQYQELDVVMLNGNSFVARYANPGPCPGDGWKLHSLRGKAGPPGPKGDRGDAVTGPPGPPGPGLAAMTLSSEGVLTLTFEDGRSFSQDFYQPFSQMIAAVLAQLR